MSLQKIAACIQLTCQQIAEEVHAKLEPRLRQHLRCVYTMLAAALTTIATGTLLQLADSTSQCYTAFVLPLILVLVGFGGLYRCRHNHNHRCQCLLVFAFGLGRCYALYILRADSYGTRLLTAKVLVGTALTFGCLTMAAILAPRRQYLQLGTPLLQIAKGVTLLNVVNCDCAQPALLQQAQSYIGIAMLAGFIVYDTQCIIENYRAGCPNPVRHAFNLLLDYIVLLRRIQVSLALRHPPPHMYYEHLLPLDCLEGEHNSCMRHTLFRV